VLLNAAASLGKICPAAAPHAAELAAALWGDNAEVWASAAEALGKLGPAVAPHAAELAAALRDENENENEILTDAAVVATQLEAALRVALRA
jgi:hypothetical protein